MSDVRTWLVEVGLGQYAGRSKPTKSIWTCSSKSTIRWLKEIGVAPSGVRLHDAIAKLAQSTTVDVKRAVGSLRPKVYDLAERRHVTVMLCDFVGSTALPAYSEAIAHLP